MKKKIYEKLWKSKKKYTEEFLTNPNKSKETLMKIIEIIFKNIPIIKKSVIKL